MATVSVEPAVVSSEQNPSPVGTPSEEPTSQVDNENEKEMVANAMTLDVAYQSLEMIRKVNLQVEFGREIQEDECVLRLREEERTSTSLPQSKFGKWMAKKGVNPCLTCGTPVCSQHRSNEFWKQNITICNNCSQLFSVNHLVDLVFDETDPILQKKRMNDMMEVYDRALLVLCYSTQFIDDVAMELRGNTMRHNKIGLGSSATGVVAGSLGVAGK